jgi:hypothetical protein
MNCSACANPIPEGSQFCNHCGTSMQAKPRKKTSRLVLVGGAVALCGLAYLGMGSSNANRVGATILHTPITFTNETQNLGAHSWRSVPVQLPYSGTLDITMNVDRGNPLDVYLVTPETLEEMKKTALWRNIRGNANFSAVKTTTYHRDSPLDRGTYYFVMRDTSLGIFSASGTDVDLKIGLRP